MMVNKILPKHRLLDFPNVELVRYKLTFNHTESVLDTLEKANTSTKDWTANYCQRYRYP